MGQNEIGHVNSPALDAEISRDRREGTRRRNLGASGIYLAEIQPANFHIARVERALAFHGSHQTLPGRCREWKQKAWRKLFRQCGCSRKARRARVAPDSRGQSGPEIHTTDRQLAGRPMCRMSFPPKKSALALRSLKVRPSSSTSPSNCSKRIGVITSSATRRRPCAARRATAASGRGVTAAADPKLVRRAKNPGLARGPSQRSRSAVSRRSAARSKVHCGRGVALEPAGIGAASFLDIVPCQLAPSASAADNVIVCCAGENSTCALSKRTGWFTYAGLTERPRKSMAPSQTAPGKSVR